MKRTPEEMAKFKDRIIEESNKLGLGYDHNDIYCSLSGLGLAVDNDRGTIKRTLRELRSKGLET